MTWKAPIGRIVRNTNAGSVENVEGVKFNDNILLAKGIDASKPRCYPINSGIYKGKKVYINRFVTDTYNN